MVRTILARIHARPANVVEWMCVRVGAESDGRKRDGRMDGWREGGKGKARERDEGRWVERGGRTCVGNNGGLGILNRRQRRQDSVTKHEMRFHRFRQVTRDSLS